MPRLMSKIVVFAFLSGAVSGCAVPQSLAFVSTTKQARLVEGPAIVDLVTPFDRALDCIKGKIDPSISFAVGQVIDATGKETYSDGGAGKMLSQGAGEMVQSALFRSGVTVVNRRDPNIAVVETQWGIRDIKQQTPANFYISGSINSLDFIPGDGFDVNIAGFGVKRRQARILIALDLSLTDTYTGRIIANVPLQKQIFTRENGVEADRFFETTLISLSAGGMKREAVHFAMRQMLNYATLELIGQLIPSAEFKPCQLMVSPAAAEPSAENGRGDSDLTKFVSLALERNRKPAVSAEPPQQQAAAQPQVRSVPQAKPSVPITPELRKRMDIATANAGRAIVTAQAAGNELDLQKANDLVREATQYLAVAIQALREAAGNGLSGPEGDAVAVLVERAMTEVQDAGNKIKRREANISKVMPDKVPASNSAAPDADVRPQISGSRAAATDPKTVAPRE